MQNTYNKIMINQLKVGDRFSSPVFFDDGENMFLAGGKEVKPYHLFAVKQWNLPFLLSYGHLLADDEVFSEETEIEELEELL